MSGLLSSVSLVVHSNIPPLQMLLVGNELACLFCSWPCCLLVCLEVIAPLPPLFPGPARSALRMETYWLLTLFPLI